MAAAINKNNANQSAKGRLKYRNMIATIGAATKRRTVKMLGIFQTMISLSLVE
jgi:hypothetical protein